MTSTTRPSRYTRRLPLMDKDVVAEPKAFLPAGGDVCRSTGADFGIRSEPSEPKTRQSLEGVQEPAVLETYQSEVHEADPDPHVPRVCFLDLKQAEEMSATAWGTRFPGPGIRRAQTGRRRRTGRRTTKPQPAPSGPAQATGPECSGQPKVHRRVRPDGASGGLGSKLLRGEATGVLGRRFAGELDASASAFRFVHGDPRLRACPELRLRGGVRGASPGRGGGGLQAVESRAVSSGQSPRSCPSSKNVPRSWGCHRRSPSTAILGNWFSRSLRT